MTRGSSRPTDGRLGRARERSRRSSRTDGRHGKGQRIVTIVSAAALAIAGAVLATPAANAWTIPLEVSIWGSGATGPDLTDIVRATPTADSDSVDGVTGSGTTYGDNGGFGTGLAPTLNAGSIGQAASGIQVKLPVKTVEDPENAGKYIQYATWLPGEKLAIDLPPGVAFTSAPTVHVSPVVALGYLAGHATYAPGEDLNNVAADPQLAKPTVSIGITADGSQAVLTLTTNQWGVASNSPDYDAASVALDAEPTDLTGAAEPGFLLTIDNVKLDVASDAAPGPISASVLGYGADDVAATASVNCPPPSGTETVPYVGGATTIAWVSPFTVTVAGSLWKTYAGDSGNPGPALQPLGDVTIAERTPAAFANGATYTLSVTAPSGGHAVALDAPVYKNGAGAAAPFAVLNATFSGNITVTFSPKVDVTTSPAVTSASSLTFDVSESDSSSTESVTLSNLRILGVTAGPITVAVTPSGAAGTFPATALVNDPTTSNSCIAHGDSRFSFSPAGSTGASGSVPVVSTPDRIAGADRYDTAARIAGAWVNESGHSHQAVVVANGETYKDGMDALAANYLAGQAQAPILLTPANSLPKATAAAVLDVLSGRESGDPNPVIYIMGKSDSVSDDVAAQLNAIARAVTGNTSGNFVTRVAGNDRYETSAKAMAAVAGSTIATATFDPDHPDLKTAVLASGLVNADALAAGPVSYSQDMPVLLTKVDSLPQSVADAITNSGIKQIIVLGDVDRVSDEQIAKIKSDLGVELVKRIAGSNRFETSVGVVTFTRQAVLQTSGLPQDTTLFWDVYLANGLAGFPDALSVGPLAGEQFAPLLTVDAGATLPPSVAAFLSGTDSGICGSTTVTALGQSDRVTQSALNQAKGAVSGTGVCRAIL